MLEEILSKEKINFFLSKCCQNLPFDLTFYEKDGICQKPCGECEYLHEIRLFGYNKEYLCHKKTRTYLNDFLFKPS